MRRYLIPGEYEDDMDLIDDLLTEGERKVFPIASVILTA